MDWMLVSVGLSFLLFLSVVFTGKDARDYEVMIKAMQTDTAGLARSLVVRIRRDRHLREQVVQARGTARRRGRELRRLQLVGEQRRRGARVRDEQLVRRAHCPLQQVLPTLCDTEGTK